jgi:hypothetical protein
LGDIGPYVMQRLIETAACPECAAYDRVHDQYCPLDPDYDPTVE